MGLNHIGNTKVTKTACNPISTNQEYFNPKYGAMRIKVNFKCIYTYLDKYPSMYTYTVSVNVYTSRDTYQNVYYKVKYRLTAPLITHKFKAK